MSNLKSRSQFHIGKVLWWSKEDGNGIILDAFKNECYFDRSVLKDKGDFLDANKRLITNGECFVKFQVSKDITHINCCDEVQVLKKGKDAYLKEQPQFEEREVA